VMRTARGLLKLNRHTVALWYLKMLYVMLYTSCSSLHVLLEATPLEVDGDYVRRVEAMLDGEHSFNAIQLHRARGWNREVVVECEELSRAIPHLQQEVDGGSWLVSKRDVKQVRRVEWRRGLLVTPNVPMSCKYAHTLS